MTPLEDPNMETWKTWRQVTLEKQHLLPSFWTFFQILNKQPLLASELRRCPGGGFAKRRHAGKVVSVCFRVQLVQPG